MEKQECIGKNGKKVKMKNGNKAKQKEKISV